jgi:hypothetical protein
VPVDQLPFTPLAQLLIAILRASREQTIGLRSAALEHERAGLPRLELGGAETAICRSRPDRIRRRREPESGQFTGPRPTSDGVARP